MIYYFLSDDENGYLLYIIDSSNECKFHDILFDNGILNICDRLQSGKYIYFVFPYQLEYIKEILNKNETCEVKTHTDFDLVVAMVRNY